LLIKLKRTRSHNEDRKLALWLATAAGLLNAIALGAFGFFPSHMTGNTSQLSSEVSNTDLRDVLFFSAIIVAFVSGAVLARIIVLWGIVHNCRLIFCQILFVEGILLTGISLYEIYFHAFSSNREIVVVLCGLMGLHNSTSTQLSGGRVRSTHITGTLTDAGISLASVLAAMLRRDFSKDSAAQKSQLKTHLTTIFSFLTGGIAGLFLFRWFGFTAMSAVGVVLMAIAALSIVSVTVRVRKVRTAMRGMP